MEKEDQLRASFSFCTIILVIFISASTSLASSSFEKRHICSDEFKNITLQKNFPVCRKMHTLDSALGWKYFKTDNGTRLDILFGAKIDGDHDVVWLAWGVNPGKTAQMVGTKAIIGIRQPNQSTIVHPYDVTEDTKHGCKFLPSPDIGIQIVDKPSMDYDIQTRIYTISAKLILPSNYDVSKLNHLWQVGFGANGAQPLRHPITLQHVNSAETINLATGQDNAKQVRRGRLRIVHGIMSLVGWGTFLPIGIIIARYFRVYPIKLPNERGYRLHVLCQIIGYTIGTIGWGIGLFLGHLSTVYIFSVHRTYGIVIFTCATAQIISYRLRPNDDDDYRKYWNMYHHFLGYGIIVLIIINIFHGIAILNDGPAWKWAYVGVLGLLGLVVLGFEIFTWVQFSVRDGGQIRTGWGPDATETTTNSPAHQGLAKSGGKTQSDLPKKQQLI